MSCTKSFFKTVSGNILPLIRLCLYYFCERYIITAKSAAKRIPTRRPFYHVLGTSAGCRSSTSQMFFKIGVLKNFAVFAGLQLYLKETPVQVFSCECCKIFKSNDFDRAPLVAASVGCQLTVSHKSRLK